MGVKVRIIKPGRKHSFSWDIFFQRSQSTDVKWAEDLQKSLWRASQGARFKVCCTVSWLPFFSGKRYHGQGNLSSRFMGSRVHDLHSGEHFNKQVGMALEQYLRAYSWSPSWRQRCTERTNWEWGGEELGLSNIFTFSLLRNHHTFQLTNQNHNNSNKNRWSSHLDAHGTSLWGAIPTHKVCHNEVALFCFLVCSI